MATPKKHPEFEIPPALVEAMTKAIGPKRVAELSSNARSKMVDLANTTAAELGRIIEDDEDSRPD